MHLVSQGVAAHLIEHTVRVRDSLEHLVPRKVSNTMHHCRGPDLLSPTRRFLQIWTAHEDVLVTAAIATSSLTSTRRETLVGETSSLMVLSRCVCSEGFRSVS